MTVIPWTTSEVGTGEHQTLTLHFLGQEHATLSGTPMKLRRRFCEILVILATNPCGVTSSKLGMELYGEWSDSQNQALEIHRLSKLVPIQSRPYRVTLRLKADFLDVQNLLMQGRLSEAVELYQGELLPFSDAPAVSDYREYLHESVRSAVLASQELDLVWKFATRFPEDLEIWEHLQNLIPVQDLRLGMVRAKIKVLTRRLQVS